MYDSYKEEAKIDREGRMAEASQEKTAVNEEEEILEVCVEDFSSQLSQIMRAKESPLPLMRRFFPELIPVFGLDFFEAFVFYFEEKCENRLEILRLLLDSNQKNVLGLVEAGIIGKAIVIDCPDSLETILEIIVKVPTDRAIDSFVNSSGCYQLVRFSRFPQYLEVISRIFEIIQKSSLIEYSMPLFPPIWEINFLSSEPVEEFPDLYMEEMMHNLLKSESKDVLLRTLSTINQLFSHSIPAVVTLGYKFVDLYCQNPTEDEDINTLTIQVLTAAFTNGLNTLCGINSSGTVPLENKQFMQIRGIADSIINDPLSNDTLLSAAVDLITSFIDTCGMNSKAFDLYKDTSILTGLITRSKDAQYKAKRSILKAFLVLFKTASRTDIVYMVSIGIIGALCEFVIYNSEDMIEDILKSLYHILFMCTQEMTQNDIDELGEIIPTLDEFVSSENSCVGKWAAMVCDLLSPWFHGED